MSHTPIVIAFCGRYPSEKAAAIFADESARALQGEGADVTVVAPRRLGRGKAGALPYKLVYLPTLDLTLVPLLWEAANVLGQLVFSKWFLAWLVFTRKTRAIIISNEVLPLLYASLVSRNLMYELHDFPQKSFWIYKILFRRVRWILSTNNWKTEELQKRFGVDPKKIITEKNGVDTSMFGTTSKESARKALGLSMDEKLAVYTGHLYDWKGVDTFAKAAASTPDISCVFVGGTEKDIAAFRARWGSAANIRIIGHVAHESAALWQSAADVLVLPNTAKEEISMHYTSPMKLFEYMASGRAIVASELPSIREIASEREVFFASPDSPESFATAIFRAISERAESESRARNAKVVAEEYAWNKRAKRILSRLQMI